MSPRRAALTKPFAKDTQHDTSKVLLLPRKKDMGGRQSAAPAMKNSTHLLKTWHNYCAYHAKPLLTRHETCWNVTKCHACHAKRSYAKLENWKSDTFFRTYQRHGHMVLTRTVANGCERLRMVADGCATSGEHSSTPTPPE